MFSLSKNKCINSKRTIILRRRKSLKATATLTRMYPALFHISNHFLCRWHIRPMTWSVPRHRYTGGKITSAPEWGVGGWPWQNMSEEAARRVDGDDMRPPWRAEIGIRGGQTRASSPVMRLLIDGQFYFMHCTLTCPRLNFGRGHVNQRRLFLFQPLMSFCVVLLICNLTQPQRGTCSHYVGTGHFHMFSIILYFP